MISLPSTTEVNARIPKQKFYEKLSIRSHLEKIFVSEIETIVWKNKLSPETIALNAGKDVSEIHLFEITLKSKQLTRTVLETIDSGIPYHLVFILRYKDEGQLWISYKEQKGKKGDVYKVEKYYSTDWMPYSDLHVPIEGLDLDHVYASMLAAVSGGKLEVPAGVEIKDEIARMKDENKRQAYIESLEKKIKNEKQFNRQVELKRELEGIKKSKTREI
jgi:hypothetical protein